MSATKKNFSPDELLAEVRGKGIAKTYEFDEYIDAIDERHRKEYSYAKIAEFLGERLGITVNRGQVFRAHRNLLNEKNRAEFESLEAMENEENEEEGLEMGLAGPENTEKAAQKVIEFLEGFLSIQPGIDLSKILERAATLLLRSDLKWAEIERKDGLGRVVHFHSFRKTFQTLGVGCGMNQRAAQEILGHSDANLTAKVYTDVASLQLHDEIAKLPWISPAGVVAQHSAQNSGASRPAASLGEILGQLIEMVKVTGGERVGRSLASNDTPMHFSEMAAWAGIEPASHGRVTSVPERPAAPGRP